MISRRTLEKAHFEALGRLCISQLEDVDLLGTTLKTDKHLSLSLLSSFSLLSLFSLSSLSLSLSLSLFSFNLLFFLQMWHSSRLVPCSCGDTARVW